MNNIGLNHKHEHNINNPDKPPKILYKYARWDKEYHKRLITTPEIYFASPGDFNDPYDCKVFLRYDMWSEDDWKAMLSQALQSKYSTLTNREIKKIVEESIRNFRINPQSKIDEINRIKREENSHFIKNIGVFSLSETKESILMWSHYANSHKGFCIGYYTDRIKKCVDNHFSLIPPKNKWIEYFKIEYSDKYQVAIPVLNIHNSKSYKEKLITKFKGWEYEKERRLIVNQNKLLYERIVNIPIEAIAEINLGFRMSQANIANIIFELKSLNYKGKLYKAEQEEYRYQLAFNEIIFGIPQDGNEMTS